MIQSTHLLWSLKNTGHIDGGRLTRLSSSVAATGFVLASMSATNRSASTWNLNLAHADAVITCRTLSWWQ